MNHNNFLKQLKNYYAQLNYSKDKQNDMLQAHLEKLEIIDAGYKLWIEDLLGFFKINYCPRLERMKILDIGCGTGELVIRMNLAGHQAYGIDVHRDHLNMAKILASENGLSSELFIYNDKQYLPFEDNEFDLITSFSVFEHLDDKVLHWMIPELNRICKSAVFTLVPNPMKPIDDHTGLAFLGHLPRFAALIYIKLRGKKYQYLISRSNEWDVYYRYLNEIKNKFKSNGFDIDYIPDNLVYPSLKECPPIKKIGKNVSLFGLNVFIGINLFTDFFIRLGTPKQFFYPYLNIISIPKIRKTSN